VTLYCGIYPSKSLDTVYSRVLGIAVTRAGAVAIYDENYAQGSATDFKTAMNGKLLIYPLATPEDTTLQTKTVIPTLLGANNIYHDCNGDTDVTYRANGALYVQEHPITRGLMAARPTEQIQEQEES
jgi:hypothetical protein